MAVSWAPGLTVSPEPLRKVVRRSSPVNNGWHRTNKNPAGFCGGESKGELEFMMFAEIDPNVTAIAPQPCDIPFSHDAKLCRHIPDFAILERDQSLIFEVKSRRQYGKADLQRRLRSAARSIEARGWPYFVVVKEEILAHRLYANVAALWRWLRPSYTGLQQLAVTEMLSRGCVRIADVTSALQTRMGSGAPSTENILSMGANGLIFVDLDDPIGAGTRIRFADRSALPDPLLPRRRPADDYPWESAA